MPGFHCYNDYLQYQTYDVTSYLKRGDNLLSVYLGNGWYRGRLGYEGGFEKIFGDDLALIFEMYIEYVDGSEIVFFSDESCEVRSAPIIQSGIYDGEYYDANKENNSWLNKDKFDIEWTEEYNVTYLPEGFSALTLSCNTLSRYIEYADGNDNSITLGQNIDTTTYSIDTENAKVEYLDINGKKAMYVEKEYEEIGNTNKLLWKEDDYFIGLDGIGVTKEELVKVAESVKKN